MDLVKTELDKPVATTNGSAGVGKGDASESLTVLTRGDSLQGRLSMKGNGQLLGAFSGEVECEGELFIGPDAQVGANIRTRNIVISGFVRGNVVAVGRLKITSTGRLEGDARIGALIVQEGGVHHGAIHVHPEGVPEDMPEEPAVVALEPVVSADPMPAVARVQIQAGVDRVKKFWGEFF